MKEGGRRVSVQIRENFEDARLLAVEVEEGAESQEMQAGEGREMGSTRMAGLPAPSLWPSETRSDSRPPELKRNKCTFF